MQLWLLLNPYGNQEAIEGRILYVFLKLAFDPYWDGSEESLQMLIAEVEKLVEEIKRLQNSRMKSTKVEVVLTEVRD